MNALLTSAGTRRTRLGRAREGASVPPECRAWTSDASGQLLRADLLPRLGLEVDLDRLLDARGVEALSRLVPMRLDHELQRVPQVLPALVKRLGLRDRAGDLFDPTHKPSVRLRLDDGVVPLLHGPHCEQLF